MIKYLIWYNHRTTVTVTTPVTTLVSVSVLTVTTLVSVSVLTVTTLVSVSGNQTVPTLSVSSTHVPEWI